MMLLVRAAVLGLAAYGAKHLYDQYRDAEPRLREQGRTLTQDVQRLAGQAKGTARHAKDAATETASTMAGSETPSGSTGSAGTSSYASGSSVMEPAHPGA
jgi:hypothetical protein